MDAVLLEKVKRLCRKFADDLQSVFDEMDGDTYWTNRCERAAHAQALAVDVAEGDE